MRWCVFPRTSYCAAVRTQAYHFHRTFARGSFFGVVVGGVVGWAERLHFGYAFYVSCVPPGLADYIGHDARSEDI